MSDQNKNHLSLVHSADTVSDPVVKPTPELALVPHEDAPAAQLVVEHAAHLAVGHEVELPTVSAQVIEAGNDFLRQQDIAEGKYE